MNLIEPARGRLSVGWIAPALLCAAVLVSGCAERPIAPAKDLTPLPHPVRLLLTFDDGPSTAHGFNPTGAILDQLAANPVQPRIKALFFIQTRVAGKAGAGIGLALLRRMRTEGHVLGFHSSTARGHIGHPDLPPDEFEQSLADGIGDIRAIQGTAPRMVRPPFWLYDQGTLAAYRRRGLHMLLTDINARDGKIIGWNISLGRRGHFRRGLADVRDDILNGRMPLVAGVYPVVVTFHDTNTFTARRMQEYLSILLEESARVGLTLARKPFYDQTAEIEAAAFARRENGGPDGEQGSEDRGKTTRPGNAEAGPAQASGAGQ